jgi:hypothetical protein
VSPLFRRNPAPRSEGESLSEFWTWWREAHPRLEAAIAAKDLAPLVDELTTRVKAIHPELAWEVGPGLLAANQLCVTGEGDFELRTLAERWLKSGPAPDGVWEFHAARQAEPAESAYALEIDGVRVDPAEQRFSVAIDESRERLDVSMWHPTFATLQDEARTRIAFLTLDGLLGEDGVERWLGTVTTETAPLPAEALDRASLRAAISDMRAHATGERFVLGKATDKNGKPLIVALNTALKRIDHLGMLTRLRVTVHVVAPDGNGFPGRDEADALDGYEGELSRAIPDSVFAGRVTGAGRRSCNWYVADAELATSAARAQPAPMPWRIDVQSELDTRWEGLLRRNLVD